MSRIAEGLDQTATYPTMAVTVEEPVWAVKLSHILGGFETAGFIHRCAALIMFVTFLTHLVDLVKLKRREHSSWKDLLLGYYWMIPGRQDMKYFIVTM